MSVGDVTARLRARDWDTVSVRKAVVRAVFGDRLGLTVFLGSLCLFALTWRTSVFINDTFTLANGLYSLTQGELLLTEPVYGGSLQTPGAIQYGDRFLARNYGALVLSLPFLALVEGLTLVTSLRVGLLALWSLVALGFVVQLGRTVERDGVILGGSVAVLAFFLANLAVASPVDTAATHLYALQLFHLAVAAAAPVLLYRLLVGQYGTRPALGGTLVFVFGSPLALWATVPKRHVITVTVVLGIAYCLYRSRAGDPTPDSQARFRGLAYALVMLYAWIHAPEALLLAVALAAVDVPTAPDNSPRSLVTIGLVAGAGLVPFLVTNALLTGDPIRPPRLLYRADPLAAPSTTASGESTPTGSGSGSTQSTPLPGPVDTALQPFVLLGSELLSGVRTAVARPGDVVTTFLRSGHTARTVNQEGTEAVNLSVLESAPVLAALVGGVPALVRRRGSLSLPDRVLPARTVVDAFAVLVVVGFSLLYIPRLPVYAQITARYLFVIYPLGLYLLVRLPAVRGVLEDHWRLFCWSLAGTVLIGGQLVVVFVALALNGLGEAFQFHAVLALGTAVPLALWSLRGRSDGWNGQLGALLVGATTGVTTVFVGMTVLVYYPLGNSHALPLVRLLAQLLELL